MISKNCLISLPSNRTVHWKCTGWGGLSGAGDEWYTGTTSRPSSRVPSESTPTSITDSVAVGDGVFGFRAAVAFFLGARLGGGGGGAGGLALAVGFRSLFALSGGCKAELERPLLRLV